MREDQNPEYSFYVWYKDNLGRLSQIMVEDRNRTGDAPILPTALIFPELTCPTEVYAMLSLSEPTPETWTWASSVEGVATVAAWTPGPDDFYPRNKEGPTARISLVQKGNTLARGATLITAKLDVKQALPIRAMFCLVVQPDLVMYAPDGRYYRVVPSSWRLDPVDHDVVKPLLEANSVLFVQPGTSEPRESASLPAAGSAQGVQDYPVAGFATTCYVMNAQLITNPYARVPQ